jgi:hypothetical protein
MITLAIVAFIYLLKILRDRFLKQAKYNNIVRF